MNIDWQEIKYLISVVMEPKRKIWPEGFNCLKHWSELVGWFYWWGYKMDSKIFQIWQSVLAILKVILKLWLRLEPEWCSLQLTQQRSASLMSVGCATRLPGSHALGQPAAHQTHQTNDKLGTTLLQIPHIKSTKNDNERQHYFDLHNMLISFAWIQYVSNKSTVCRWMGGHVSMSHGKAYLAFQ